MHAIVCAREMVAPEARAQGSHGDLVLYTSDQSHSSIEKGRDCSRHRATQRAQGPV